MDDSHPGDPNAATSSDQRLWAPWRMAYVGKRASEQGCIFCNRLAAGDDVSSLILTRGQHSFVIMNLYPYNTGHVMLVPRAHVADLAELDHATLTEMALTMPRVTRALRRALNCHGFNLGLNIGAVAGAGVADHIHQHVVPRWNGDANFMPITASTTVMPELIPVTYAKLRAEIAREMEQHAEGATPEMAALVWSTSGRELLVASADGRWQLPRFQAQPNQPLWRTVSIALDRDQGLTDLFGIAAAANAHSGGRLALTYQSRPGFDPGPYIWMPLDEARGKLPEEVRSFLPQ
ncbi:MAG: HIT family protein [Thermomicrobiales bacterium]